MRRKKGFTLMELIIVISIFGVLVAVITPTWAHYLQRSKLRAQNARAKTVFNAAQTVLVDLEFTERKYLAALSDQPGVRKYIYTLPESGTGSEWYFYWDGQRGYRCNADGSEITTLGSTDRDKTLTEWNEKLADSINRIVDEDIIYKFKVVDYKVVAVATANNLTDRFIGAHPTSIIDLKAKGVKTNHGSTDFEHTNVASVNLDNFTLNVNAASLSAVNVSVSP